MSSADSLLAGPVSKQREGLGRGDIRASDLLDASLTRIGAHSSLNAVISIREQAARSEAEASDRRHAANEPLSALDGIPVLLKDNIVQAAEPATCASRILEGFTSPYDAY